MAHGLPILAANVDSLPELMKDYKNGEIIDFTPGNSDSVCAKILDMKDREKIDPKFPYTIEEMLNNYESLYSKLAKNP
jgi:glycosyltransferase involved in cell wall biosynthesis